MIRLRKQRLRCATGTCQAARRNPFVMKWKTESGKGRKMNSKKRRNKKKKGKERDNVSVQQLIVF